MPVDFRQSTNESGALGKRVEVGAAERLPAEREQAAASEFAKRHPGSPLVDRIAPACRPSVDFSNSLNGTAGSGEPIAKLRRGDQR